MNGSSALNASIFPTDFFCSRCSSKGKGLVLEDRCPYLPSAEISCFTPPLKFLWPSAPIS